jgi:HK97 family phage portal protein
MRLLPSFLSARAAPQRAALSRIEPEITAPAELRGSFENPATSLSDPSALARLLGAEPSAAGVRVSPESVLGIPAVFAAVRLIAETVGTLPLNIYRESGGRREVNRSHPMFRLLHRRPNLYTSALAFRLTLTAHALLWGKGLAWIERNGAGQPIALWPFEPWFTEIKHDDRGRMWYEYRNGKISRRLDPAEVIHIPWLELEIGSGGLPVTRILRNLFGAASANIEFSARFYKNGAMPSIVFTTPAEMSSDGVREFAANIKEKAEGLGNAYRSLVTPQGVSVDFPAAGLRDQQHIEQSTNFVIEIARIFNVPPHMIQDLSRATFSNIEEQGLNFVRHTIGPWLTRWTGELDEKVLPRDPEHFCGFNTDQLTAGNQKSKMESYSLAVSAGVMTPNEARALEGLPPLAGGDDLLRPVNLAPADRLVPAEQQDPEQTESDDDQTN